MTRQTDGDSRDINTSDAAPGDVLISLTHPRSFDGGRRVDLEIRDQMSGQTVIRVSMLPEEFAEVMSSTGTCVGGAAFTPHPERLGRRSQNTSTVVRYDSDRTPEQVRDDYLAAGWEQVRVDRTNYGHRVVAYRWIDDETAEEG